MRQKNDAFAEPYRLRPALGRTSLILRVVIDCSYLFRSRLATKDRVRILVEYVRLTLKTILRLRATEAGTERVLGYSVRHFGIGSLQFLFREIFVRGEYFLEVARDNPLVFDCGANIGLSTLFFKWLYPHCEIHAFEPDPETFAVLKENVDRNRLADVHLHNVALTDAPGQFAFFVPAGSSGSPLMSIVAARGGDGARRIVVEGAVLSSYIGGRQIDLLKMDVEGAEERVLREAAAAGALRTVREIAVEYHHNLEEGISRFGAFLQLLQEAGYQYQVDATWKGGEPVGAFQDILVRARRSTRVQSVPTNVYKHQEVIDESHVPCARVTPNPRTRRRYFRQSTSPRHSIGRGSSRRIAMPKNHLFSGLMRVAPSRKEAVNPARSYSGTGVAGGVSSQTIASG